MFYFTYFLGFIVKVFAVKALSEYLQNKKIISDYLWTALLNIRGNLIMVWSFYGAWNRIQEVIGHLYEIVNMIRTLNG